MLRGASQAFDDARNRANPFEGVRKEFFINRAAAKMAAMDAACGWIFSYADAADPAAEGAAVAPDAPFGSAPLPAPSLLRFGDVAAGPGGFSEYLLWRRGGSAHGLGFTLRGDHDFTLQRFHFKALPELFHPYYGLKDDGDLYQTDNLRALQALVGRQTAGAGLHVVMADGGFDVSGAENIQEVLNKQLLLTQFAAALGCLAEGGHFVCKAFDLFTPFSAGLLYLMYRCFEAVCVYKPAASRPANSERYVICRGLRRANPPAFEFLLSVNDRLNRLKTAWKSSGGSGGQDVTGLAPAALLQAPPFGPYLLDSNNRLGRLQATRTTRHNSPRPLRSLHSLNSRYTLYSRHLLTSGSLSDCRPRRCVAWWPCYATRASGEWRPDSHARLQRPCAVEAAPLCSGGCNPMQWRLRLYAGAATRLPRERPACVRGGCLLTRRPWPTTPTSTPSTCARS